MDAKESISILSNNVRQLREMLRNRENDCTILDKAQTLLDTMEDELRWLHDCIDNDHRKPPTQDCACSTRDVAVNKIDQPVTDKAAKDDFSKATVKVEVKMAFKEVLTTMAESLDES